VDEAEAERQREMQEEAFEQWTRKQRVLSKLGALMLRPRGQAEEKNARRFASFFLVGQVRRGVPVALSFSPRCQTWILLSSSPLVYTTVAHCLTSTGMPHINSLNWSRQPSTQWPRSRRRPARRR
jgi:hypothetical protein